MTPRRTCVGCRVATLKSELLRLVADGDAVIPDRRGRLPGRGAHLHPCLRCLELAERRRAIPRALHRAAPLDVAQVRAYLSELEDARDQ